MTTALRDWRFIVLYVAIASVLHYLALGAQYPGLTKDLDVNLLVFTVAVPIAGALWWLWHRARSHAITAIITLALGMFPPTGHAIGRLVGTAVSKAATPLGLFPAYVDLLRTSPGFLLAFVGLCYGLTYGVVYLAVRFVRKHWRAIPEDERSKTRSEDERGDRAAPA
jgi:hypothetical protein